MSKHKLIRKVSAIAAAVAMLGTLFVPMAAQAAQITNRSVTLGSSTASASTSYTLSTAALPSATPVQSLALQACTTASGACSTPAGFTSVGSATTGVTTGLGTNTGWTNNTAVSGSLRITQSNAVAPSGTVSVPWTAVTNPSATNTTYFLRLTTYSDTAWTTPIDSGVIAVSTSNQIDITASVDEALTFCTGTSGITTSSCAGAIGNNVNLGTLTPTTTGSGTSQIGVTTNAQFGYAITYLAADLTSGGNTIDAIGATATPSSQGTEQFGLNLRDNTTPNVGSDPAGAGTAVPTTQYNIVDSFAFVPNVATAVVNNSTADAFRQFTVSYIANVAAFTQPGTYTTSFTYVCTPTF